LGFILRGITAGAMTVVAHALGGQKQETAARLTTHAVLLTMILACVITIAGLATIKPLFMASGATGEVLLLTEQYMRIWYYGTIFMVVLMTISDIIIGTGNTKMASLLMVGGTVINFFLDPIMIFGLLGFPKMGIQGAALATILSQAIMMVVAIYILHKNHRLFSFSSFSFKEILMSWRRILHMGIPSALSSILNPISVFAINRIVANFSYAAIAAFGVASRIEMFAFMIPMTVGMSLVPFTAQNYGAQRLDRVEIARKGTITFALIYGFAIAGIFFVIVRPLAGLFSDDPEVINVLTRYIRITCFGYGFLEVHRYSGFFMTGIHKPIFSGISNIIRIVVLLIPLSFACSKLFGLSGVFWGRLSTDIIAGSIGIILSGRILQMRKLSAE
jgi:putative MATE family efflux protein